MAFVVGAYLLGSFPTAGLVGERRGHDPSAEGSGNPGTSNVYRLMGRRAAALVLVGDLAKVVAAALAGDAVAGRAGLFACGAAAVVGHCFPAGRRRHGGKGVATGAGVFAVAAPAVAAVCAVLWIAVVAITRKASPASLAAMVAALVGIAVTGRPAFEIAVAAAIAALVVVRHRANLGRLLRGDERSLH